MWTVEAMPTSTTKAKSFHIWQVQSQVLPSHELVRITCLCLAQKIPHSSMQLPPALVLQFAQLPVEFTSQALLQVHVEPTHVPPENAACSQTIEQKPFVVAGTGKSR